MSSLYKVKWLVNDTIDFSTATFLQEGFISLNVAPPTNVGTVVDKYGQPTSIFSDYSDIFSSALPFVYDSSFNGWAALTTVLNYFNLYQVMGVDVKNVVSTTNKVIFLTTDNSPYYMRGYFSKNANNSRINTYGLGLFKKSDNSRVGSESTPLGFLYAYNYSDTSSNQIIIYNTGGGTYRLVLSTRAGENFTISSENGWDNPNNYNLLLSNDEPYIEVTDPYNGAGDSTTGGGDGTFDGSSDAVPVPSLPSIGATDTGFISLFVPSASQIKQVASYLWSSFFDLATFKKIFEDPMDCILGLSVVPVSVPTSGSAQITVGNVELSGISLPLASQQYVEVDCGTVDFTNRFFGSYLDFEPYTKMSLFVPYSGIHAVSADDIIGKVVGLKYHIDILTGSLVAFLTCGSSVLYEFNGACASNIPVNSLNYASTIENAVRIAVNIGTTVATAGAAAPATAAGEGAKLAVSGAEVGRAIALGGSTAQGALSLKPSIDRAGSLGGTTGLMGNQIPYFIITRPRMCKPKNQDVFQGYPSFIQTTLGDMEGTGFTAFENVILAGSYLTDTEKRELESILTAGVYL